MESIIKNEKFSVILEIPFSDSKARVWAKSAGAKWDSVNKNWVLEAKQCTISQSVNFEKFIIPSHLVSYIKN